MDIKNFVKTKNKIKEFNKRIKDKTKEEIRELETKLLIPERCTDYIGPLPTISSIDILKISLIFPNKKLFDLMNKYFKIATYCGNNIVDISLLISFLRMLENGDLIYDKKNKKLSINGEKYS